MNFTEYRYKRDTKIHAFLFVAIVFAIAQDDFWRIVWIIGGLDVVYFAVFRTPK